MAANINTGSSVSDTKIDLTPTTVALPFLPYSLRFARLGGQTVHAATKPLDNLKDLVRDFGFAVQDSFSAEENYEMKDVESNDWKDQDGSEDYLPDAGTRKLKAVIMSFPLVYKGAYGTAMAAWRKLMNYLTGGTDDGTGCWLYMYVPYMGLGVQGCYFTGAEKMQLHSEIGGDVLTANVKIKICYPRKRVSKIKFIIINEATVIEPLTPIL